MVPGEVREDCEFLVAWEVIFCCPIFGLRIDTLTCANEMDQFWG